MSRTFRRIPSKQHRRPRTRQEKRLVFAALEEGVPVRSARRGRMLVDDHTDIPVAARAEAYGIKD